MLYVCVMCVCLSVCDYLARKPGVRERINETKMVHHMKYTLSCRSVCLILHAFGFVC